MHLSIIYSQAVSLVDGWLLYIYVVKIVCQASLPSFSTRGESLEIFGL